MIPDAVAAACEMLGPDPLNVANEGVLVAVVAEEHADRALAALRGDPLGREAAIAGRVVDAHPGMVTLRTTLGATRVVDLLPGDQCRGFAEAVVRGCAGDAAAEGAGRRPGRRVPRPSRL